MDPPIASIPGPQPESAVPATVGTTTPLDSDVVLNFQDILNGKAGEREAAVAQAWSNGDIRPPPSATLNLMVESEAGFDMRIGNKKRRRQDPDYGNTHDSKTNDGDQAAEEPAAPPVHEAIKPAVNLPGLDDIPPAIPAPVPNAAQSKPPPPKPAQPNAPALTQPSTSQALHPVAAQLPAGSNARVKSGQPVPDCFQVLMKLDSAGKVRKTFVTPDNRRWYTLKEAKAHWEAQGGDLTCTTHPTDKPLTPVPPAQPPPAPAVKTPMAPAAAAATPPMAPITRVLLGLASYTVDTKRQGRLKVPDQFHITSKVDAGGKERKLYYTPDGRKFVSHKEAKAHWEGLGHTLTYTGTPVGPPPTLTPPPATAAQPPKTTPRPASVPKAYPAVKGPNGDGGSGSDSEGESPVPVGSKRKAGGGGASTSKGTPAGQVGGSASKATPPVAQGSGKKPVAGERWLPPGWKTEKRVRGQGNRSGQVDWIFTSPDGTFYRSYVAAQQAFQCEIPAEGNPTEEAGPPLESLDVVPAALKSLARIESMTILPGLPVPVARIRTLSAAAESQP